MSQEQIMIEWRGDLHISVIRLASLSFLIERRMSTNRLILFDNGN